MKTAQGCTLRPAWCGSRQELGLGRSVAAVGLSPPTAAELVHRGNSGPLLPPPPQRARVVGMSMVLLYRQHGSPETRRVSQAVSRVLWAGMHQVWFFAFSSKCFLPLAMLCLINNNILKNKTNLLNL